MGKFYENFKKQLNSFGLEAYYVALILLVFGLWWVPTHFDEAKIMALFLAASLPFVLPVLFWIIWTHVLLDANRQKEYWSTEHTLFEIRLPEEITQSPHAMELLLRVFYQTGEVDTILHHWRGKTRPWFSLEIASTEGVVRFYIWMRSRYKDVVKAQIYAHYPTVQVVEVPDYTLAVPWDTDVYDLTGIEFGLQKPDPYPIQTYMAWNVEKPDTKEEFKNDPLVSILEFMGSLGKGEHAWLQLIIKGHTKSTPEPSHLSWNHEVHEIEAWTQQEILEIGHRTGAEEGMPPNFIGLSEGDKLAISSMQYKLNKQLYDVGIRFMHVYKKELKGRLAGLATAMRSFEHGSESRGLNGLKPIFYIGPFNWPWQDFMGIRRALLKKQLYQGYVTRQYFYDPNHDMHIVLNIEEIATLYHFPGKVAHTPTLERMPSRRAEAPANLPV